METRERETAEEAVRGRLRSEVELTGAGLDRELQPWGVLAVAGMGAQDGANTPASIEKIVRRSVARPSLVGLHLTPKLMWSPLGDKRARSGTVRQPFRVRRRMPRRRHHLRKSRPSDARAAKASRLRSARGR